MIHVSQSLLEFLEARATAEVAMKAFQQGESPVIAELFELGNFIHDEVEVQINFRAPTGGSADKIRRIMEDS